MALIDVCTEFAAQVCQSKGDQETYIRIRTGETRKGASVAVSGIRVGEDPGGLAVELERRLRALAGEGRAWVEAIAKGDTSPVEVLPVALPELGGSSGPATREDGALSALVACVSELSGVVRGMALSSGARVVQLEQERAMLVAELASYQTAAQLEGSHEREGSMDRAIQALSPIAWGVAQRLGVPVAAMLGDAPAPAPAGSTDELVGALVARLEADPGELTQSRMAQVIGAAQRARARQPQAPRPEGSEQP